MISDPAYHIPRSVYVLNVEDMESFKDHVLKVKDSVKGKTAWTKHAGAVVEEHLKNKAAKLYDVPYDNAVLEIYLTPPHIFMLGETLGYKLAGTQCEEISKRVTDLLRNNCVRAPKKEPMINMNNFEYGTNSTSSNFAQEVLVQLKKLKVKPVIMENEPIEEE